MSDILDTRDGLHAQLVAPLPVWSGDGRRRRSEPENQPDNNNDDDSDSGSGSGSGSGSQTPIARQHVYIRNLMEYADQGPRSRFLVNDDIDADSDDPGTQQHLSTPNTAGGHGVAEEGGAGRYRQQQLHQYRHTMGRPPSPPQPNSKPLRPILPLAFDTTLSSSQGSSQPQMSHRISRFPFSHPCDIPELMPDCQDDTLNSAPSPLASGPATPSVVHDVFRSLTDAECPALDLGPFSPLAVTSSEADFLPPHHQPMRKISVKTLVSEMSDGLGIIEEEGDVNADGVSMLTPTEASFGTAAGESVYERFNRFDSRGLQPPKPRSISSSTGSTGSSEWRPSTTGGESRKSLSLFSRIRGGRNTIHEEPLEKRSLTPYELSAPPPKQDDDMLPDRPPQSVSSSTIHLSTIHSRVETTVNSRFFSRMPWLGDSQPQSGSVFGIDLNSSIKLAPVKMRVSHRGRSTSYRTYPLSVYKCCDFIRKEGLKESSVFCSPGNALNVAQLKEIFDRPPTYGENFTFEGTDYTVFDAARLVLLYLEELPKPLISSSVLRCWILLARQEGAIEPPCPRVETGLDFWAEALSRLPTTSRNLVKHLLGLFAECLMAASQSGTITEADARHFASAVSRALFHHDTDASVIVGSTNSTVTSISSSGARRKAGKKNVHPTLALAFLIKKRGEYSATLGRATAASAARRDTKFLPSTKEMMQWKGLM